MNAMDDAFQRLPIPELPPLEDERTFTGPREHLVEQLAVALAPTFGVEVTVVARRRVWGGREELTLRAVGRGDAVARFWGAVEDAIPVTAPRGLLGALFNWWP